MLDRARMGIREVRNALERPDSRGPRGVKSIDLSPEITRAQQVAKVASERAARAARAGYNVAIKEIETPEAYKRGGLAGALLIATFAFGVVWILNGFATAWGSRPLIFWALGGVNRLLGLVGEEPLVVGAGLVWLLGAALHVAISFTERHLYRARRRVFYSLLIPANLWDQLTTSVALCILFFGTFSPSLGQATFATVIGLLVSSSEVPLAIAISMLIKHVRGVKQ